MYKTKWVSRAPESVKYVVFTEPRRRSWATASTEKTLVKDKIMTTGIPCRFNLPLNFLQGNNE